MRKLNLDKLKSGQLGLTPEVGSFMVQAAIVCLINNGHQSGVILKIEGDYSEDIKLIWSDKVNQQVLRTWQDSNETVEYGATALSALLLYLLEGLEIYERIPPDGEADYYLQSTSTKKITGLLEVSGILKETKFNNPKIRVRVKQRRIEKVSKVTSLPIYIVVTEFGVPKSKIMNSIARKYHQVAMDLYDFGKIYKAKGNPKYYQGNLQLAYLLDKQAAISVQSEAVDVLWQAVYPRSASWLAYECGKYIEAKELAELGLKHKKNISDYEIIQLQNLLEKAKKEIEKGNSQKEKELVPNSILAIASAANIDQYLQIRQIKTDQNSLVKIASEDSLQLTKSFLGDMVEIEIKANENGELTLKDIRRAA